MKTIPELIKQFELGEHLTNAEMVTLRDAYQAVSVSTQTLGDDKYALVGGDAYMKSVRLTEYLQARGVE